MSNKKKALPDLFNEETKNSSQDFASLFEESLNSTSKRLHVGDKLNAKILSIGKEESFVSTGTHRDAVMATADLKDDKGLITYKVGDVIEAIIVKIKDDEIRVTRRGSKAAPADIENLEDAFDMELPVEGKVTEVVNGGYRVNIQGQSAFCPISQLDSRPITDAQSMIGKKFDFIITQFDAKKRNIVVSRRKLLDLKKAENEGAWLQTHKIGDVLSGIVTRTETYGAFVDMGEGIEGLVHVSEIGFTRIKHANESVRPGDPVQVKILKIDDEGDRLKISLSIKQAGGVGDPWMMVPQQFPVGTIIEGVVDKKADFGLFISIGGGISGLLPRSKWRDSSEASTYENKRKGDSIKVKVDEIKFEERKISLGLPTEADDESWRQHKNTQKIGGLAAAFAAASQKKN